MSQNPQALPDPQTAYNNLFAGVHQQVFFQKCAAAGFAPRTPDEAQWMLEVAGQLRAVDESQAVKQATEVASPYYQMKVALDSVLAQHGFDVGARQHAEHDMAVKEAAAGLAEDPLFYNSVLALKAAEAAQLQQEFEQAQGAA